MFRARSVSPSQRKVSTITFGGVDRTSPTFSISSERAIDESNYVWRDGVVKKRYGTNPLFMTIDDMNLVEIPFGTMIATNKSVTGTVGERFQLNANDPVYDIFELGDYLLIHKGSAMFYTLKSEMTPALLTCSSSRTAVSTSGGTVYCHKSYRFPQRRMYGITSGNALWLLTGVKYLKIAIDDGALTMQSVSSTSGIYIPVTTTGIAAEEAESSNRQTLRDVNQLTNMRTNELAGGYDDPENLLSKCTYVLDGAISEDEIDKVEVIINTIGRI